MGCGCKTNETIDLSGSTSSINKNTIKNQINDVFEGKRSFSILGIILFLVATPLTIFISIPLITVLLFNRFVLGKNIDLIKLLVYRRNKSEQ